MSLPLFQVAVPRAWWDGRLSPDSPLASLAREALDIERRLSKGVDLGRERSRYSACCRMIETFARGRFAPVTSRQEFAERLAQNAFPAARLAAEYLDFLNGWLPAVPPGPAEARLAASFFPPDLIAPHLRAFEAALAAHSGDAPAAVSRRLDFLRQASEADCGVVEFADLYAERSSRAAEAVLETRPQRVESPTIATPRPPEVIAASPEEEARAQESELALLGGEVERALERGTGVNFSNYHHPVIATVLRELAYRQEPQSSLPVLYGDGSQAEAFPVGGLVLDAAKRQAAEATPPLRAALISIRHPEMDGDVDFAWFPNRSASRPRESFADTDGWCFRHSLEMFGTFPADRLTVIELYQTGLETAVVGFYRALAVVLREGRAPVAVRPRIFRARGVYVPGEWWV